MVKFEKKTKNEISQTGVDCGYFVIIIFFFGLGPVVHQYRLAMFIPKQKIHLLWTLKYFNDFRPLSFQKFSDFIIQLSSFQHVCQMSLPDFCQALVNTRFYTQITRISQYYGPVRALLILDSRVNLLNPKFAYNSISLIFTV